MFKQNYKIIPNVNMKFQHSKILNKSKFTTEVKVSILKHTISYIFISCINKLKKNIFNFGVFITYNIIMIINNKKACIR